jgi:hypothetical protein
LLSATLHHIYSSIAQHFFSFIFPFPASVAFSFPFSIPNVDFSEEEKGPRQKKKEKEKEKRKRPILGQWAASPTRISLNPCSTVETL